MNGEFDLELYTIAMTRLNNGFAKVGDLIQDKASILNIENQCENRKEEFDKMAVTIKRTLPDFKTAKNEFENLYLDIKNDLNQSEIRLDDYEPFFQHAGEVFPQSIKDLNEGMNGIKEASTIATGDLKDVINELTETIQEIIKVFDDIYSVSNSSLEKIKAGELR